MEEIALSEHEAELQRAFLRLPEYMVADWATQNLALVIHRARDWAGHSAGEQRRRAIVLLTVRLLRFARAGMAVHACGWEMEGRAYDRLVMEARARLLQVTADPTDETGRLWLSGKLSGRNITITGALVASFPELDRALP